MSSSLRQRPTGGGGGPRPKQLAKPELARQRQPQHIAASAYVPSLSLAFRILSIVRIVGALTAPLQDCDEVFNYWEPLHLLQFGWGKQTWEYAPQYALRSYAYLEVHRALGRGLHFLFGFGTRTLMFYAIRIALGVGSALCEAVFVRAIAEHVDRAMANYTFLALAGMAGMFHSASALLPSSFSMCLCMLGSAAAMAPAGRGRVVPAACAFAVAATWGWPYSAIVALPFVVEELLERRRGEPLLRCMAIGAGTLAATAGAAALIDSWHYGSVVVAGWNQISYNVLGRGGDSALYGTEPWYFYVKNGLLNANLVMALALVSLPLWLAYDVVLRLAGRGSRQQAVVEGLQAAHRSLLFRVLPFYVALGVFSLQPHKEERFLSIVYPHMCFSAAAALALLRPLYARATSTRIGLRLGYVALCVAAGIGVLRMAALTRYYGAPARAFLQLPGHHHSAAGKPATILELGLSAKSWLSSASAQPRAWDRAAPERVVCMGRDWYRFPSSFWLPPNHRLQFIASPAFDGHLPGDFVPAWVSGSTKMSTSMERSDFNSANVWEPTHAVQPNRTAEVCDYIVGVEYPGRGVHVAEVDSRWQQVAACEPILDSEHTSLLARVLYIPPLALRIMPWRQQWGQMCVYAKKNEPGLEW
ncbi:hypothetical protein GGI20_001034 [Coemansia sp. BCRC 34301]|nr:hypothetical protein GGI20_001034 [Coemansia sp. BCRC 34301]